MTDERLGNLGILALYGFDIQVSIDRICEVFKVNIPEECVAHLFCMICPKYRFFCTCSPVSIVALLVSFFGCLVLNACSSKSEC